MGLVSEEWELVNKNTGEVRSLITFAEEGKRERWEKVYAKSLVNMLEVSGDEKVKVIAYMIKEKDYENRVMETVRSIAKATGISTTTVHKTLQILQEHNYIHKVRNGLWRFSPHVMVNGNGAVGAAVFRAWETEAQIEE